MHDQIKELWPTLRVASLGRPVIYRMRRRCLGGEGIPDKGNSICKASCYNKRGGALSCTVIRWLYRSSKPPWVDKEHSLRFFFPLRFRVSALGGGNHWGRQSQFILWLSCKIDLPGNSVLSSACLIVPSLAPRLTIYAPLAAKDLPEASGRETQCVSLENQELFKEKHLLAR